VRSSRHCRETVRRWAVQCSPRVLFSFTACGIIPSGSSMLTIRAPQMEVLQGALWESLIDKHIRKCFPGRCLNFGDSLPKIELRAIRKAKAYGFATFTDIQQFVDLVIVLGENFERSCEFEWAREVLEDPVPAHRPFRANWLYERVLLWLKEKE
jgi:hypothetical protein